MKKLMLVLCTLFLSYAAWAQETNCNNGLDDDGDFLFDCLDPDCSCNDCSGKQADQWHFGTNAGINFSSGTPTAITGSALAAIEGSSSISDANGHLLFYTNGLTVYNRNNTVMLNGTGLFGSTSTANAAVIVPMPNNRYIYYIFHAEAKDMATHRLSYSVVDMRLDNGLGAVVAGSKNIVLHNTVGEHLTAVRHCNGKDFWIIAHVGNTNQFLVYSLSTLGFNPTPSIQAQGLTHSLATTGTTALGLRASKDGKRLAAACYNAYQVFDFDNANGIISNPIVLSQGMAGAYGVEFSENGRFLYGTSIRSPNPIYQYDLAAGTATGITASQYTVASFSTPDYQVGNLLRGPDDKIYLARSASNAVGLNFVSIINNPNNAGAACGFVNNAFGLGTGLSRFGFPTLANNYGAYSITIKGATTTCADGRPELFRVDLKNSSCADSVRWICRGNNSYSANDSVLTIIPTQQGVDTIFLFVHFACATSTDTLYLRTNLCNEICNNGLDDDEDGLTDCYDLDCCGQTNCSSFYYTPCNNVGCTLDSLPGTFSVAREWQNSEIINNLANPVVGDIDNDGVPEIIAMKLNATSNGLVIFDGASGAVERYFNISTGGSNESVGLVLADMNNDGFSDIIVPMGDADRRIRCYDRNGLLLWTSSSTVTTRLCVASVADFNGDGKPEVYVNQSLLNGQNGQLMGTLSGASGQTGGQFSLGGQAFSVAADVLPDDFCTECAGLEWVAGNTVYAVGIDTITNTASLLPTVILAGQPDGPTAVADWNADGQLDAIVTHTVSTTQVRMYVWNLQNGTLIGATGNISRVGTFGTIGVSNVTLADIDKDGLLEAAFTLNQRLVVIENNFSIKWSVSNSDRSGITGVTLYDFDGNGSYELVYRDESNFLVYNAITGAVRSSTPCASLTGVEYPIVADIDGDGQTEVLTTCNTTAQLTGFLTCYASNGAPWMPARKLWNQYQYFGVNINDNLSVPRTQQQHHLVGDSIELNIFRMQHLRNETPVADAAIDVLSVVPISPDSADVTVEICNQGDNALGASTPLVFYNGDPTASAGVSLLGPVFALGATLSPGACQVTTYRIALAAEVYAVVNANNSVVPILNPLSSFPMTTIAECDYSNNFSNNLTLLALNEVQLRLEQQGNKAFLSWNSPSSMPYHQVSIERSTDAVQFSSLSSLLPLSLQNYEDQLGTTGQYYYRLKIQAPEGSLAYSNIVGAYYDGNSLFAVYPNPVKDKLYINNAEAGYYELRNYLGQTLNRFYAASNAEVDFSNLPQGVYLIFNSAHRMLARIVKIGSL